jgi:TP901 family phage tail tape measure protein
MFAEIPEANFEAYTSGAMKAGEAMSMFAQISDEAFKAYSAGTISAEQAMKNLTTASMYSTQDWQQMWNTFHNIGVECGVTANDVSVFGKLSDEAFAQYSTGAMSADAANASLRGSTEQAGNAAEEAGNKTADAGSKTANAANSANKASKAFGLLHTVFLRLAHTAITQVTRAFRQSFDEMQNVDKQLTTVSRVTQTNISDLDGLKTKAYEVGSAYGVMASDYLSGVAAFTRAGYKDQAEDLAELSTKMQVAGEVSAETANQLLIATDKAYGFNGSVTKLSSVMDKMTYVDHNYATSVEKIAEGMGIVAPVAAQAHMSVDELIASLGTITAVTQRSGSESARALRALILSIIKDTTTEVEDGVTMTVDEVNSVQDALKKYAPEVVKAAEATGELIDPMEAIAALSKSFEEGLLDEQGLAKITSALGGKLRASQLLSLIQNFSGMYTEMMEGMGNSMGIVDKDTQRYLDSWQGKLNQLKNSFTGFTESIFDPEAVKGFIDAVNYLIKAIDNPEEFGEKFASTLESSIGSIVDNLPRLQTAITDVAFMFVKSLMSSLKDEMPSILKTITEGARHASDELMKELPDIMENVMNLIGTLVMDSIINGDIAQEIGTAIALSFINAIPKAIKGLNDAVYDAFNNVGYDQTNDGLVAFERILGLLGMGGGAKAAKRYGIMLAEQLRGGFAEGSSGSETHDSASGSSHGGHSGKFGGIADDSVKEDVNETAKAFESLSDKIELATKKLQEYKTALEGGEKGDALKSYSEAYKSAVELYNKGLTGTNAYKSAIDLLFGEVEDYEAAGKNLGNAFFKAMFEGGGDDYGAAAANWIKSNIDKLEGVVLKEEENGTFGLNFTDVDAFAKSVGTTTDAVWTLIDALDAYNSETTYTREQLYSMIGVAEDASSKTVDLGKVIQDLAGQGKSKREIKDIVNSLKELANTDSSLNLKEATEDIDTLIEKGRTIGAFDEETSNAKVQIDVESNIDEVGSAIQSKIDDLDGSVVTIHVVSDFSGFPEFNGGLGGAGGSHHTTTNAHASGTKSSAGGLSLVNEEGAELIYADGRAWIAGGGKPTITNLPVGAGVFNAKETREIFSRSGINSFAGGYVGGIPVTNSSGGKVDTKKIEKILDELSKYVEKILKKAKEALDKQLKEIDAQIEALEREHDAEEDKNKLEELRLKILEAEKKLAEAENERTVRYFNKETGQWEWMADQKAVEDARKALQEAQEAYDKEVEEQAYQAQIQALKDLKEALQQQYEDLADHWEEIINAIKEAGEEDIDIEQLLKRLGLDSDTTGDIRELIKAIQEYERKLSDGTYEVPLDSATTAKMFGVSGMSASGVGTLSQMFGMSTADTNSKGTSLYNMSTSNVGGDTNYYINGIKIGSDMLGMTLSQILSVLPIYANAN